MTMFIMTTVHNNNTNTYDLQITFLTKFNNWGNAERDFTRTWSRLTFNVDTHTVYEFTHEPDLLAALLGGTNAQIIDTFKEAFASEIESQLLDIVI